MALPKTELTLPLTNIPPIQLWIGESDFKQTLEEYLCSLLCATKERCFACNQCQLILKQQHTSVLFLHPPYTLETLEPIKERIEFILADNELYFFIIPSAEKLLTATANALLKSLEEPPKGYHFILQTNQQESILPTVCSRSVIFHFKKNNTLEIEEDLQFLYDYFTAKTIIAADTFLKLLETHAITEQQTTQLLTKLLAFFLGNHHEILHAVIFEHLQNIDHTTNIKLLWKNLFLQTLLFLNPVNK